MGERDYQKLSDLEMDILKEAGNIASGNAMTALGSMLGCKLDMNVAKVRIENIQVLDSVLGEADNVIAGMIINIVGDINAMLLLALETKSATKIINKLLGRNIQDLLDIDELGSSVLCEIGNILAGTYVSALTSFTKLALDVSIPLMAIDMAGAILSYPAIEFLRSDNTMLFIETAFNDAEDMLSGTYILILDNIAYKKVVDSLGIG